MGKRPPVGSEMTVLDLARIYPEGNNVRTGKCPTSTELVPMSNCTHYRTLTLGGENYSDCAMQR